jgi:hypothetical protein
MLFGNTYYPLCPVLSDLSKDGRQDLIQESRGRNTFLEKKLTKVKRTLYFVVT